MSARLSAAVATALAGVICLQTGPFLPLFFAVPLFTVLFVSGRAVFVFSALLLVFFNAIAMAVRLLATGVMPSFGLVFTSMGGIILLLVPLMCMLLPAVVRHRYRVTLAGIVSALLWVAAAVFTDAGENFKQLLLAVADNFSEALSTTIPSDSNSGFFAQAFSKDGLYGMMRSIILYSLVPMPLAMFAASWRAGYALANFFRKDNSLRYPVASYYNERIVLYVLSAGMIGIILQRYIANEVLAVASWNVFLVAAFWLVVQGAGIASFFIKRIASSRKGPLFWLGMCLLILSAMYAGPFMIIALLIVGVVEQFVPIRRRFDDKDTVDPTPGRGRDQNQ